MNQFKHGNLNIIVGNGKRLTQDFAHGMTVTYRHVKHALCARSDVMLMIVTNQNGEEIGKNNYDVAAPTTAKVARTIK